MGGALGGVVSAPIATVFALILTTGLVTCISLLSAYASWGGGWHGIASDVQQTISGTSGSLGAAWQLLAAVIPIGNLVGTLVNAIGVMVFRNTIFGIYAGAKMLMAGG